MTKNISSNPKKHILKEQGTLNPHPGKVKEPVFKQDDFFDCRDLLQVKYEMLRKVKIDKHSVTDTSKSFGFTRLSFYNIQTAFQKQGLAGLFNKKRGPKKPYKMTEAVIKFIKELYQKEPRPSVKEIKQQVEKYFRITIHKRTIERALVSIKKKTVQKSG